MGKATMFHLSHKLISGQHKGSKNIWMEKIFVKIYGKNLHFGFFLLFARAYMIAYVHAHTAARNLYVFIYCALRSLRSLRDSHQQAGAHWKHQFLNSFILIKTISTATIWSLRDVQNLVKRILSSSYQFYYTKHWYS